MDTIAKVFLLTSEFQDINGRLQLVYYGRSPKLGPVEIVVDNVKACFMVLNSADLSKLELKYERKELEIKSLNDEALDGLYFKSQNDASFAANFLAQNGVQIFEADVKAHERYLMERMVSGQCAVKGQASHNGRLVSFKNPSIQPCEVQTDFRVCSLDIECGGGTMDDIYSNALYSIGLHSKGCGEEAKICFMLGDERKDIPEENLYIYPSEADVLKAFMEWFEKDDPDIIIGWHVIGFDLDFLQRKCEEFYLDFNICRNDSLPVFNSPPSGGHYVTIPGRIVFDGPQLMRDMFYSFPNYKLETVAQEITGEGKTITLTNIEKVQEIEDQFRNDKISLARYNIQDCVLVHRIFDEVGATEFMTARTRLSGLMMDSLGISAMALDHLYLPRLHRKGYAAPSLMENARGGTQAAGGDELLEHGIYDNVIVLNQNNLMHKLMEVFRLDPLGRLKSDIASISTPGGYKYSSTEHILPEYLGAVLKKKIEATEAGLDPFNRASRNYLNLLYKGVNAPSFRLFTSELKSAVKAAYNWFINQCKELINASEDKLVYADEDYLFIATKANAENYRDVAARIVERLNESLASKIKSEFSLNAEIQISFESFYRKVVFPLQKVPKGKSARRFAGLQVLEDGTNKEVFHDLALTGSDWTPLAQDFQQEMYRRIFNEEDLELWIKDYVTELKDGKFVDKMYFKRRLTKAVEEYIKNIPPHVRAAQHLEKPGKIVSYAFTLRGPLPEEMKPKDMEYQFYMDKQLAPVADSVLSLEDKTFEGLFNAQQMSLFDF